MSASSNSPIPEVDGRVRVFGVGGAGVRMVQQLVQVGLEGAGLAVLNTDAESLRASGSLRRLQLGARLTRGLGAGGDPEVGRAAAEEALPELCQLCKGAELVFLVAGLGGGTGTGAGSVVARVARECGAIVVGLVTLPFECEGARRQRQAARGLSELKASADVVLCLPSQRVLGLIEEHTPLVEAFRYTDELLLQGLRGIWRLACRPGLINVDLADLRDMMRDLHTESFFASTEAAGDRRATEVVERLLLHPLLDNGTLLRETGKGLVSLVAGAGLSISEVHRIMERLRRECDGAELLLGASVDPALGDRLSLTFIGTRRGAASGACPGPASGAEEAHSPAAEMASVETDFFRRQPSPRRPKSRFVPPAPELTPEQREQALARVGRSRARLQQTMLPLEVLSKGRFEKSEPTLHRGEDLDVPAFVRRGMVLN